MFTLGPTFVLLNNIRSRSMYKNRRGKQSAGMEKNKFSPAWITLINKKKLDKDLYVFGIWPLLCSLWFYSGYTPIV